MTYYTLTYSFVRAYVIKNLYDIWFAKRIRTLMRGRWPLGISKTGRGYYNIVCVSRTSSCTCVSVSQVCALFFCWSLVRKENGQPVYRFGILFPCVMRQNLASTFVCPILPRQTVSVTRKSYCVRNWTSRLVGRYVSTPKYWGVQNKNIIM